VIPDRHADTTGVTMSTITIPVSEGSAIAPEVIAQVRARVKIVHTRLSDIRATLTGPDGTTIELVGDTYGTRQDVDATYIGLVDNPITNYYSLPGIGGEWQRLALVSYHGGMSVAGNWTLAITDNAHSDYGALDGWSLDFVTAVPYVTVTASIPDATEAPTVPGQFTVTRAVITTQPLTVNLLFEGTAANGVDYEPVLYTVIIPAYQASQTIAITPILQPQWKGSRTVIATVTSGSGYIVGTAGGSTSATVTIADGPGKHPSGIPLLGPWQMVLMALLLAGTGVMAANWRRRSI